MCIHWIITKRSIENPLQKRTQKQSNKQQTDPWSVPVENATWKKKQFQEWELDEGNILRFDSWLHALSEDAHREHKNDENDQHRRVDED